jgi:hypothetical protein
MTLRQPRSPDQACIYPHVLRAPIQVTKRGSPQVYNVSNEVERRVDLWGSSHKFAVNGVPVNRWNGFCTSSG